VVNLLLCGQYGTVRVTQKGPTDGGGMVSGREDISGRLWSTNLMSSNGVQWCHRANELDCGQAEGDCWASLKFGGGAQSKSVLEIADVGDVKTRPRRSSNPLLSRDTGSDAGGCGVVAGSGVDPVSALCADRWRKGSR